MKSMPIINLGIIFINFDFYSIYMEENRLIFYVFFVLCAKDWRGAEGVGLEKANEGTEPRKAWPMPFKAAEHPYI